ncbi:MAG: BolA/IbaG family iron-sulfur metabolism protein [Gammaproteobacteria bacterium]|nr:BolA/IbaG family iron-sulfur metabolism protein [Gammaproteobacteria bacterium]
MNSELIKQLLDVDLPQCEITVEGGDGKYLVTVAGNVFEGLNAVKRQQKIYQILSEHISSGAIHAITMRLFTVDEFNATT